MTVIQEPIEDVYTFNEAQTLIAIQYGRKITFSYPQSRGSLGIGRETRTLIPQVLNKIGENYVVTGHDIDRDALRAFRVDRIVGDVAVLR